MNIAFFLTPKSQVAYIREGSSIRQGLEKMQRHGYTCLPVISKDGRFLGCINEGDFLWNILSMGSVTTKDMERARIDDIISDRYTPVRVTTTMEELLRLPGVGRKTANLLLGDIYKVPGSVVCDTHCIRICGKLGLSHGKDPEKVEQQLRKILPPEKSNDFCHRLVLFGREICTARSPKCGQCPLSPFCLEANPEAK